MKKVLLIMPHFYDYPKEIKDELQKMGMVVDLVYEEPPTILFLIIRKIKSICRFNTIYSLFALLLYLRIIRFRNKYDFFIVIRGNILNKWFISKIINNYLKPGGKSIYYTWDALSNLDHKGNISVLFDNKFTFDLKDARNDPSWCHVPLFYSNKYNDASVNKEIDKMYDITCVAGFNENRYKIIKNIVSANKELKFNIVLYIDRQLYNIKKETNTFYDNIDTSWLSFEQLKPELIIDYYNSSKAILDVPNFSQSGLSMRTIESIGLEQKLITTNKWVREYDFYSESNIIVIGDNNLRIDSEWLNSTCHYNEKLKKKYSLSSWLKTILEN